MRLSVALPHTLITADPHDLVPTVQRLEAEGFDGVAVNDHVAGGAAERQRPGEVTHTIETPSTDPFVMLAMVAAVTTRLTLTTEILILPQRQTLVVAKQAAELDRLSGGRLRLGVGVGRNWMEYEALNEDFSTRGARMEEQITVLRRLWTEELVTFEGRWHHLDRIGLNPLPARRPIPIWMGSYFGAVSERVLERTARMADGWLPQYPPGDDFVATLSRMRELIAAAGRAETELEIECAMSLKSGGDPAAWRSNAQWYADHGATELVARVGGTSNVAAYLETALRWRDAIRG